ncbi:M20/M25/M40 family metallo-hydrolase [Hymenobacter nivis]|nr:M20/M25/M40 family metallo-hydrolase [Hymenobacter nivis]
MPNFLRRWLPLLGLLLFAALAIYLARAPQPVPAGAPATAFSAERALREVAVVARAPHSIGTPANAAVRNYLLRRCRALGLSATVQDTTVVVAGAPGALTGARVQNVVARLPGRTPGGPAVLVLTHYDSQPHTPGASDDGAGVAAALETLRALHAGPPLAHDVRWVFTDGEEMGLLGARAYAADTVRLRRAVGVVLNFEARGNAGPSNLFELSSGNTWVLEEFAKAAPAPLGSSLAYEIYRYLPNGTDFTAFRAAGLPGLNFAFTGGYSYYHSPVDTPERLDLASLQHHGDYMLPLVRHFASISLAHAPTGDSSFFNPLGTWLVVYRAGWNWALSAAGWALLLLAIGQARGRGRLRLAGLLGGALAWLVGTALLLAAGWYLARAVGAAYPQYAVFYDHAFYNVGWYHLALAALGAAVFTAYYGALRRWLRPDSLTGGVLLVLAGLQAFLQVKAPTSGFLLGIPIACGALGWLWQTVTTPRPFVGPRGRREIYSLPLGPVGALLAVPAVALLAPDLRALFTLAGLGALVPAGMFFLAVLLGLLLPALLPALGRTEATGPRWALPLLAAAVALGALAAGHATSRPTAEHPQQTHVFYTLDANRGQAYWLSSMAGPDAWTQQFFSAPTMGPLPELLPGTTLPVLHQGAPRLALAPPTVTVLADTTLPTGRRLRLQVRPARPGVVSLNLVWPTFKLNGLRVAGHAVAPALLASSTGYNGLTFFAPGPQGFVVEFELSPGDAKRLQITAKDRSLGLPTEAKTQPLPANMVAAPGYNSFTTQVTKRFQL